MSGPIPAPPGPASPRFGLFVGGAGKGWSQILDEFQMADELGYDHAWLVDHLLSTDGPLSEPILEAWSLMAALAARTERVRLGVLVTNNLFRHPALLMKAAVTVDHISDGRLILGLGTGWYEDEHRRYGIPFPVASERVERLEEAILICRSLMEQPRTTFAGRHYRLDDAPFEPRPLQRPRIPILVGAHRPRMLRIAARHADIWDSFPPMAGASTDGVAEDLAEQIERLERYCRDEGRDPMELRRSTWVGAEAAASEAAFLAFFERHRRLGFTDFTTSLPALDDRTEMRRIAVEVIPRLRS